MIIPNSSLIIAQFWNKSTQDPNRGLFLGHDPDLEGETKTTESKIEKKGEDKMRRKGGRRTKLKETPKRRWQDLPAGATRGKIERHQRMRCRRGERDRGGNNDRHYVHRNRLQIQKTYTEKRGESGMAEHNQKEGEIGNQTELNHG